MASIRKVLLMGLGGVTALGAGLYVAGLRVELDGSGSRPMFRFGSRDARDRAVERSREAQKAAPEAAPAEADPEVVEAAAKPLAGAPAPVASPVPAAVDDYWADFRGPGRRGVYAQTPILTAWPATGLKQLWRQPVGGGYASFAVAGGTLYTIEQRRSKEVVAAYDAATGKEKWTNAWDADFREAMGGDGPRATPVWHEGRVYAQGAEGELRVIDASSGATVWRKNILQDNGARNLTWGMSNSPLIVDEKVIVTPGGAGGRSVVAYHKGTGARIWGALDDQAAYTSPMLVELAGKRQVLVVTAKRAVGLDPADGKLLWEFPWVTQYDVNSAQPILVGPDRFFISAGYGHGAALVEVGAGGAKAVWENNRMKNRFNSSVLYEGHVYGMDEAILACMDVATGELKWKGGRYGYGQLLLSGDNIVVLAESGELALVKATPEGHREVAKFPALDGKTWNHPAMSGGNLYVRNTSEMAAFRIAP